jgi:uncharacterized membrane protein YedE/YeeE
MQIVVALTAGLLFGIGLILSGMTNPAKVIGFLDLAGDWDPSLALVMAGAIGVGFIPFQLASRRSMALLGGPMRLPAASNIDRRLLLGGLAFGVGWGLAGYCPGPALASLLSGSYKPVLFVIAMVAGMLVFEFMESRAQAQRHKPA